MYCVGISYQDKGHFKYFTRTMTVETVESSGTSPGNLPRQCFLVRLHINVCIIYTGTVLYYRNFSAAVPVS